MAHLAYEAFFTQNKKAPTEADRQAFHRVVRWLADQGIISDVIMSDIKDLFEMILAA